MHPVSQYELICALFLRLLGIFYLIAFASLVTQVEGLAGSQGIQPFAAKLAQLTADYPGYEKYFRLPSLFWLNISDGILVGAAEAGCVVALLIILNVAPRLALIAAYILYLSLYGACLVFLNFQWDGLLLEAGFLAIFLNPKSKLAVFLFRWLLFRLRFMSGLSKLTSQDPTWIGLTSLNHYFEVQPLPSPLAWYAHHLPEWLLRIGTAGTLIVELLVPFMMFLPRRWRFLAAWLTILWQVLIILTSNHNWFNFLTIALCLFLFDDQAVQRVIPKRIRTALTEPPSPTPGLLHRLVIGVLASLVAVASLMHFKEMISMKPITNDYGMLLDYAETYRVINKYHVFGTMKTERIELQIEGSVDGKNWKPYHFKYRPGDPQQAPTWVIPFQPRLDWQMWFVPLSPVHLPWFDDFLRRLLDNSPSVTALLETNPFPNEAPRYLRVQTYRYTFTTAEQRAATGDWWTIEPLGPFIPLPWMERIPAQ
ncbi:MAG: lipase maturation factor family protein [Gammaproteobacteria bacterium]|nr:lipase maturation factor family protein [Gammaproteobacteria bacterium]